MSLRSQQKLERIGALYAVESDINRRSPEEHREVRDARTRPLLGSLKQWSKQRLGKHSKKSHTAVAVPQSYLRSLLSRIAEHPVNRIDELLPWNLDLTEES